MSVGIYGMLVNDPKYRGVQHAYNGEAQF